METTTADHPTKLCPRCGGTGKNKHKPTDCARCRGKGSINLYPGRQANPPQLCEVEGCESPAFASGMCSKHYQRHRRDRQSYPAKVHSRVRLSEKAEIALAIVDAKERKYPVKPSKDDEGNELFIPPASYEELAESLEYDMEGVVFTKKDIAKMWRLANQDDVTRVLRAMTLEHKIIPVSRPDGYVLVNKAEAILDGKA